MNGQKMRMGNRFALNRETQALECVFIDVGKYLRSIIAGHNDAAAVCTNDSEFLGSIRERADICNAEEGYDHLLRQQGLHSAFAAADIEDAPIVDRQGGWRRSCCMWHANGSFV
jgi:hypothetical protein